MCGIALSTELVSTLGMLKTLQHRGDQAFQVTEFKDLYLGFNRLAIKDIKSSASQQPLETGSSIIVFNGEIFNQHVLARAIFEDQHKIKPLAGTEIHIIETIMRRTPAHFERFLDGYYGIVRIDKGREEIIVSRDVIGVIPLYYQRQPFAVASEVKALVKPIEVKPGETLTFTLQGRLKKRRVYDPVSLHLEPMNLDHLDHLFARAIGRRITHSDRPVCVALSGGLDSSLVLTAAHNMTHYDLHAITIAIDETSDEAQNAIQLCNELGIPHDLITVTRKQIEQDRAHILYHLEDYKHNPIKYAAMIRNYYTAKYAPGVVILCGEGADEIGCGYPPHLARKGLELEWKSFATLRSMHAINLDRVNKGGMTFTKEFRTPFLDRALVLYCMGCAKEPGKKYFRDLAERMGVPDYILSKPKYGTEEAKLWDIVKDWGTR